jgi:hypothetical protein
MTKDTPTKILFLTANPANTVRLRLDEEVRQIDEAIRRARKRDSFVIEQRWAVRIDDLRRAMLDVNPQIIHFSGHGDTGGIVLEGEDGQAQVVNAKALSDLFSLFTNQVECVILNACYSVAQAKAINEHIKYVIGMDKPIGDQAAIKFSLGFYDAIGAGRSYDDAYKFGCNAMQMANISEQDTPVLHAKVDGQTSPQDSRKKSTMSADENSRQPLELFYSYSHVDEDLRKALETYLVMLKRQGLITGWHDREIDAGDEWKDEIDVHLNSADIILLLVSTNFLASDYAYEKEMKRAMERHEKKEARVIPIILRPCEWEEAPFSKLQALPTNGKPITTWADRDEAFTVVAKGIRSAIERMRTSR